jgi:hypothetical protein
VIVPRCVSLCQIGPHRAPHTVICSPRIAQTLSSLSGARSWSRPRAAPATHRMRLALSVTSRSLAPSQCRNADADGDVVVGGFDDLPRPGCSAGIDAPDDGDVMVAFGGVGEEHEIAGLDLGDGDFLSGGQVGHDAGVVGQGDPDLCVGVEDQPGAGSYFGGLSEATARSAVARPIPTAGRPAAAEPRPQQAT